MEGCNQVNLLTLKSKTEYSLQSLIAGQKLVDVLERLISCVFEYVMACIIVFTDFSFREKTLPVLENRGAETPIFHSPE